MKTPFLYPLTLFAVFLAACAPASPFAVTPRAAEPSVVVLATATLARAMEAAVPEEPVPTPLAAATSRGPDLYATDPGTVSLASGGLQFVEFFRFT